MSEQKGYNDMYVDSLKFFAKEPKQSATYEKLYAHLKSKGYTLTVHDGAQIKYLDNNVLDIFNKITSANLKPEYFGALDNPDKLEYKIFSYNNGIENVKRIVTSEYPMSNSARNLLESRLQQEKEYEEKLEIDIGNAERIRREHRQFKISEGSYYTALVGILLSVVFGGIQTYDILCGKDFKHEKKIEELNSIQIEQNKKIIELLKTKSHIDSVNVTVQPQKNQKNK